VGRYYRRQGVPLTDAWIETGTYQGESIVAALAAGYPLIRSVEFDPALAAAARQRFAAQANVTILEGSSPEALPALIHAGRSTTFWLDAHFQGGPASEQDRRYGECPLLAELAVIRAVPWAAPPSSRSTTRTCSTRPPCRRDSPRRNGPPWSRSTRRCPPATTWTSRTTSSGPFPTV
jgi:hypothetical protein